MATATSRHDVVAPADQATDSAQAIEYIEGPFNITLNPPKIYTMLTVSPLQT